MFVSRRKSMSFAEEDAYNKVFQDLLEEIGSLPEYQDMTETLDRFRVLVAYNVLGGKQIRGRNVIAAYRTLVPNPTPETVKEAYVLGWCIQIMQTSFLVITDLIENSDTRRGQMCWYLMENVGNLAINDAFLLAGLVNLVLDRYFCDKPYYSELVHDFHSVHFVTLLGQCMDMVSSGKKGHGYTMDRYKTIVTYKTSYNAFCLPVTCAMRLAGNTDPKNFEDVQKMGLEMGLLFQVQDDFLDCFGDPRVTGRIGTDIGQNKFSWLIVKAFEKGDESQKQRLIENYGLGQISTESNENQVIAIYKELGLREDFRKFEETSYAAIMDKIERLSKRIPQQIFADTADIIFRRTL